MLYFSIGIFLYFLTLISISQFDIELQLFRIIGELMTLPLLLILIFLACYSAIKFFKEKKSLSNIAILVISSITIIILVLATLMEH